MLGWFGRKRAAKAEPPRPQRETAAAQLETAPGQWETTPAYGATAPAAVETAPRVNLSPQAHQQLAAVLARQPQAAALRIFVKNPGGSPPQYDMALEPADMVRLGDVVVDADGLRVLVDAASLAAVEGATVDFRDDPLQPGFIVNPPAPPVMDVPDVFDTTDPLAQQVQSVLVH